MTRGSYGIQGRSSQTNNQPTADVFAPFVENGRVLSAHNALGALPAKAGRGRGAWEESRGGRWSLWGGKRPLGEGDRQAWVMCHLDGLSPVIVTIKGRLAQTRLMSCSHWSAEGCTSRWGFCRSQVTQDDAHTGTQYLWLEQSQLFFWLKAVGCVVFATGIRHLQPPESFDGTGPTADDRLSRSCTSP